jgi:hypothetical protein
LKQHRFAILTYVLTIVTAGLILGRENVIAALSGNVSIEAVTNERLLYTVTDNGQLMLLRTDARRACDPLASNAAQGE